MRNINVLFTILATIVLNIMLKLYIYCFSLSMFLYRVHGPGEPFIAFCKFKAVDRVRGITREIIDMFVLYSISPKPFKLSFEAE